MSLSAWPVALLGVLSLGCTAGPRPREPLPDLERERTEFAAWLADAAASPFRALVQHPIGKAVTLGPPESDIPLPNLGLFRIEEAGGRIRMLVDGATRPLWRGRLVPVGDYQVLAGGLPGRTVLTVFGREVREFKAPSYYPESPEWRLTVRLEPVRSPGSQRLLGPDGREIEATEAGTVTVGVGEPATLRVFRLPLPDGEESELEIFFADETNGRGSYPAGRFVNLVPIGGDRYLLDFNRARNPFCAYNAVFPCPAPWRGNRLAAPVEAGERYAGGGLETFPP